MPMTPERLEELYERHCQHEQQTEEERGEVCCFCGESFSLDYGKEETGFCHQCATDIMSQEILPNLSDLIAAARERESVRNDLKKWAKDCGKSMGDTHSLDYITVLSATMSKLESRATAAEKRVEELEKGAFIRSRSMMTGRLKGAYSDDELLSMFRPWWTSGSTEGLNPRETRLLETIAERNLQLSEGRKLTCVYCGHEYPFDATSAEQLDAHIKTCEKHPLGKALSRATAAEKRVETLSSALEDFAEYDCEYPNDPCLRVHISKLGHGVCVGCKARLALKGDDQ